MNLSNAAGASPRPTCKVKNTLIKFNNDNKPSPSPYGATSPGGRGFKCSAGATPTLRDKVIIAKTKGIFRFVGEGFPPPAFLFYFFCGRTQLIPTASIAPRLVGETCGLQQNNPTDFSYRSKPPPSQNKGGFKRSRKFVLFYKKIGFEKFQSRFSFIRF